MDKQVVAKLKRLDACQAQAAEGRMKRLDPVAFGAILALVALGLAVLACFAAGGV